MSTPIVSDIAMVCIHVADVDRSLRFYRDLLGIPLEQRSPTWAAVDLPSGVRLLVEALHDADKVKSDSSLELMLRVADVDAALEAVKAAGVTTFPVEPFEGGAWVTIVDPDGYRVVLEQRTAAA